MDFRDRSFVLNGIPVNVTLDSIKEALRQYGAVYLVHPITDSASNFFGVIVVYSKPEEADTARDALRGSKCGESNRGASKREASKRGAS